MEWDLFRPVSQVGGSWGGGMLIEVGSEARMGIRSPPNSLLPLAPVSF